MRTLAILSLIAVFAAPQGAAAEGAKPREACRADVERLCKGIEPGGGRLRECLKAHRSAFSQECRAALRSAHARRQAAKAKAD